MRGLPKNHAVAALHVCATPINRAGQYTTLPDATECQSPFMSTRRRLCQPCRRKAAPPEVQKAKDISKFHTRRARKLAAEVTGPVPVRVYEAIRASGCCVYCGDPAATADHVRPLSRGGWEHESNLVPACKPCNCSKGAKLLTEWQPDRVAHGVAHSPIVATEYERLTLMVA